MKKVVLSAFALSLWITPHVLRAEIETDPTFLGLESEILPELKGSQQFTSPELHQEDSWKVIPKNVEIDLPAPNKGQRYSIIPWTTLQPENFLSIQQWMIERDHKDRYPDWKVRLRNQNHKEMFGKILQCVGVCDVYRGTNKSTGSYLSQILEEDEIKTQKDSVAWIYLMDGSLIRMSPESSISFHEINFSKEEIFFLVRLNEGHVYWHTRSKHEKKIENSPETDAVSLPLRVKEANKEYFERRRFKDQNDSEHLLEVMNLDELAVSDQIKYYNLLWKENNLVTSVKSKVMMVAPNSTLISTNTSFDYVYFPGGKSYFKKRSSFEGEELNLHLRGYSSFDLTPITDQNWYEVEVLGRGYKTFVDPPAPFVLLELITKRIKSIELAREVWLREFSLGIFKALGNSEQLGREFGYTLWGSEKEKRFNFLTEYTRRIETTNLRAIENLLVKLESNGENPRRELSEEQFRISLTHYLLGIKSRYSQKNMKVRDMNDLQFYVWILRNGK